VGQQIVMLDDSLQVEELLLMKTSSTQPVSQVDLSEDVPRASPADTAPVPEDVGSPRGLV